MEAKPTCFIGESGRPDPEIKVRFNTRNRSWEVHTFFVGTKNYKWVRCTPALALFYISRGAPNITAEKTKVPFDLLLHRVPMNERL